MIEKIRAAREAGYSDSEITSYLGNTYGLNDKIQSAINSGYSATEVIDYLVPQTSERQKESSDFMRGAGEAFQQVPQLGYGLLAGAGALAEKAVGEGGIATGIKETGVEGYQRWGEKVAEGAKESDSWTTSYERAKQGDFGSLIDWFQHGLGYAAGQGVQILATGGLGALAAKGAGVGASKIAASMVAKETARLKATQAGAAMGAEQLAKVATANVATKIGQNTAMAATALGMEGGEIYGDLVSEAQKEGRELTGEELGRAFVATVGAGGLEFVGDRIGLDLMLGKKVAGIGGVGGRMARATTGAATGTIGEGATEYTQTLAEEWGKGNDPFSEESLRSATDAAALGALGGAAMGSAGGAISKPQSDSTPVATPTPAPIQEPTPTPNDILAAPTVDDAIDKFTASLEDTSIPAEELLTNLETQLEPTNVIPQPAANAQPDLRQQVPAGVDVPGGTVDDGIAATGMGRAAAVDNGLAAPAPGQPGVTTGTDARNAAGGDAAVAAQAISLPENQPTIPVATENKAAPPQKAELPATTLPSEPSSTPTTTPVFGTNSVGKITLRGVPMAQIQAVRDKLKLKNVLIGRDNAVFPKGTDLNALKAEFGVAQEQAAPKQKKPQRSSSDLLQRIKQLGGVDSGSMLDILSEKDRKQVGGWKFAFRKNGRGLDDLATILAAEGFNIDTSAVDGGEQQLRDMIRAHINGERNFRADTIENAAQKQADSAYMADLVKRAQELGINWRNLSEQQLDDAIYQAEDDIRMAEIARQEALSEAEAEVADAILSDETVTEDEIDSIPFGDEIPVDRAAMDAYFGVTNEERNNGQADGTAGREQAQGAEGGQEGSGKAPGFALESHTNAEVLKREAARKKAEEEAAKEPPAKNVTADQADMFNGNGTLFNSNREQPAATTSPSIRKTEPLQTNPRANIVVREVRDRDGNNLGTIIEPYDGTKEGAIKAAQRATKRMDYDYEDASNIQSRIGTTDENGNAKWAIAPNYSKVEPVDSIEGRAIFGDEDAIFLNYKANKPESSTAQAGNVKQETPAAESKAAKSKKLEVLKAQAQGKITGDQGAALKELADAGEHAAVDEVLNPAQSEKSDSIKPVPKFNNASGNFNPDLDQYWIKQGKKEINSDGMSDAEYNTAVAEYANQWRVDSLLEQLGFKRRGSSNVSSSTYFEKYNEDADHAYEIRVTDHEDHYPADSLTTRIQLNFRSEMSDWADVDVTPDMSTADALNAIKDALPKEALPSEPTAPNSNGAAKPSQPAQAEQPKTTPSAISGKQENLKQEQGKIEVLTFEQFAARNGASRQGIGEAALHRSSERKSPNTHRRQVEAQAEADRKLIIRRAELQKEYDRLVVDGKIRAPSAKEQTIATANGHPDNEATQAARRIAEKRGWDWETDKGVALFSRAQPRLYSQLAKAISNAPDKMFSTGKQTALWLQANQSKLGIKKDELYWTGIADWLKTQGKVSKADVLAFLDGNGVQVQDVVLSDSGKSYDEIASKENIAAVKGPNGEYDLWHDDEYIAQYDTEDEAIEARDNYIQENFPEASTDAPKFASYQLPGGENYRELLLTLPEKTGKQTAVDRYDIVEVAGRYEAINRETGKSEARMATRGQVERFIEGEVARENYLSNKNENFKSSHFPDQPNILAHIRFNERTDADGKRVLFLEELQSDWGQGGKKEGFADGKAYKVFSASGAMVMKQGGRGYAIFDNLKEAEDYAAKGDGWYVKEVAPKGLPSAPFVTDTKSWTALALKRMIAYAAENGFDRVAWTTGEQQAARYDLSKQIQEISAVKTLQGDYAIKAKNHSGGTVVDSVYKKEALPEVVGKELADKIVKDATETEMTVDEAVSEYRQKFQNTRATDEDIARSSWVAQNIGKRKAATYSGLDLKVGGEGMKGYYDQIVPQVAKDILKKLGGKVESVDLGDAGWTLEYEDGSRSEERMTKEEAIESAEDRGAKAIKVESLQPGFTITPEMREKILGEGLPLFSTAATQGGMSVASVESIVNPIAAKLKNVRTVKVVQNQTDIPGVKEAIDQAFSKFQQERTPENLDKYLAVAKNDIEGAYTNGKLYLVAANLRNFERTMEVLRHEVAHLSVKQMLEEVKPGLYKQFVNNIKLMDKAGNKYIRELAAAVDKTQPGLDENRRAEEIIAQIAERGDHEKDMPNAVRSLWQRLIDGIKAFHKLVFGEKMSDQDARDIVAQSFRWARGEGEAVRVIGGVLNEDAAAMSRAGDLDFTGRQAQDVDEEVGRERYQRIVEKLKELYGGEEGYESLIVDARRYLRRYPDPSREYLAQLFSARKLKEGSETVRRRLLEQENAAQGSGGESQAAFAALESRGRIGSFDGYVTEASFQDIPHYGNYFAMEVWPAEFDGSDGYLDSPILTLTLNPTDDTSFSAEKPHGELVIYGPKYDSETFRILQARGWAEVAKGKDGETAYLPDGKPWTRLTGVTPAQLTALLSDAHARIRLATGAEHLGVNWDRATGATGFATEKGDKEASRKSAIYFSRAQAIDATQSANPASWDAAEPSMFDDVVYKLQDKNIDLKRVIQSIREAGTQIPEKYDAYRQEELFHGRAAKRVQDFVNTEVKPLLVEMQLRGLKMDELDQYLHARHAREANALIAERDLDMPDGGSGMTNEQADDYLAGLPETQKKKLEAVAKRVDAIIARTRDLYVSYGLISKDQADSWAKMFQHYVPLMREDHDGGMGIGQGFSVKGKEARHRTGSTAKVVDIFANIAMQREKAVVRGEKNRVAVSLAGLANLNPNPDLWGFGPVTERRYNENTGTVEVMVKGNWKSADNVVVAKIKDSTGDVKEVGIVFNEHNERAMRMAEAIKNLDASQLNSVLAASAVITRWFASVNTQYNPIFGVTNLVRDVQGAALNLTSTPLAGHQKEVLSHIASAAKGIYLDARSERKGKPATSKWAGLWEELQDEGGMTGYRDLYRTSADRAKAIEHELDPHNWVNSKWGKVFTAGGKLKVPLTKAQDVAGPIFDWLSDYNLMMEGSTRLAIYKTAIDHGLSKQQAASLAKNTTVNFNRKGQAGQQAGALYAFFNAAMQGTARIGETVFKMDRGDIKTLRLSKTGKAIVGGGVLLGAMQTLTLALAGFDDDEPPEFIRERNLIIPIGGKKYVTIPMPLGFHFLPNIGRISTEFVLGGFRDPADHVIRLVGVALEAFNPMGSAGVSLQTVMPTAIDPLMALAENKDWTGKPIYKEDFNSMRPTPGFTRNKDTASVWSKFIAEGINFASGGTDYSPGRFSPTADQIDYLVGQVTGGVGRELSKLVQTGEALVTGEDLPTHKMPLFGRFYGNAENQSSQGNRFYSNLQEINRLDLEVKGRREDGLSTKEFIQENPKYRLVSQAKYADNIIGKLRKRKREMIERDAPRASIRTIEERITKEMLRFNQAVERVDTAG